MDCLPYEIRCFIAYHVSQPCKEPEYALRQILMHGKPESEVKDLKSLRLVCRNFAKATVMYLYTEVLLMLKTASFDRLRTTPEHPVHSKYIKTLRYEPKLNYHQLDPDHLHQENAKAQPIHYFEIDKEYDLEAWRGDEWMQHALHVCTLPTSSASTISIARSNAILAKSLGQSHDYQT